MFPKFSHENIFVYKRSLHACPNVTTLTAACLTFSCSHAVHCSSIRRNIYIYIYIYIYISVWEIANGERSRDQEINSSMS